MATTTSPPTGPMDLRVRKPMFARRHEAPLSPAELARVAYGIRHLDDHSHPYPAPLPFAAPAAISTETTPIGDWVAAHAGGEPQPDLVPVQAAPPAAPVPGWPEGVVRGLLIAALEGARNWYGSMDTLCADCEAASGLCDWHAPRYVRYLEYSELHDFCMDAASDAGALRAVAASVLARNADAGDLAGPGSHLERILTAALGTDGGAR